MGEDREHQGRIGREAAGDRAPSIGVLEVLALDGLPAWTVRLTVPHADGPVSAWAPSVFWSAAAGEQWLAAKSRRQLRPAVRDCERSIEQLAYAVVLDESGEPVLTSAPLRRVKAAGVAALLAAELRARGRIR